MIVKVIVFLAVEAAFCFGTKIDRGIRTVFQQCEDAAGMVVVVMGKHDCTKIFQ